MTRGTTSLPFGLLGGMLDRPRSRRCARPSAPRPHHADGLCLGFGSRHRFLALLGPGAAQGTQPGQHDAEAVVEIVVGRVPDGMTFAQGAGEDREREPGI
jgi:hypothetical protein